MPVPAALAPGVMVADEPSAFTAVITVPSLMNEPCRLRADVGRKNVPAAPVSVVANTPRARDTGLRTRTGLVVAEDRAVVEPPRSAGPTHGVRRRERAGRCDADDAAGANAAADVDVGLPAPVACWTQFTGRVRE